MNVQFVLIPGTFGKKSDPTTLLELPIEYH